MSTNLILNTYGEEPYVQTQIMYESIAESIAILKQEEEVREYQMGIKSYQISKIQEVVYRYYDIQSDVKKEFLKLKKKYTPYRLDELRIVFLRDYDAYSDTGNPFVNLETRFMSEEEFVKNRARLSGYN